MYDDYSDNREDEDYYERPPRSRGTRYRPPPEHEEEYPPEEYYSPSRPRESPEHARPHERPGKPPFKPPKYKRPQDPKQIPMAYSLCVVIGILLMFIGVIIITFATPTTPPPEIPEEQDAEYLDDLAKWEREYANSMRTSEFYKQVGIVVHNLGVLLTGLALLAGGLILSELDMKLRMTLIITGVVVIVVMFMIPLIWNQVDPLLFQTFPLSS